MALFSKQILKSFNGKTLLKVNLKSGTSIISLWDLIFDIPFIIILYPHLVIIFPFSHLPTIDLFSTKQK
jgi:uncharacterized membrane protein YobD (UPF0266 family)